MSNPNQTDHDHSHWRILAVDLDGTLIGWNHNINDRDLAALRRAHTAGMHIAIATGRNARECAGVIGALDLPPPLGLGVFVNGAMICDMDNGRAIDSQIIADNLAAEAVDFFGSRGHAVLVLADDPATRLPAYVITNHGPAHRATTEWLIYNRVTAAPAAEIPAHFHQRIVRLGIVVNVDQAAPLHADLQKHFHGRAATHSIYSPHFDCQIVEFFHPAATKWSGLEHLARAMHLSPTQIITIGDDINDLPMLQNATLSFAMASSLPDIQRHAKRITASQADCGIAEVVEQLLAGALEPE